MQRKYKAVCLMLAALLWLPHAVSAWEGLVPIKKARLLYTIKSDFNHPSDVAVGKNKRVYVLDGVNNRVRVFNDNGKLLFSFGREGTAQGQFNFPLGIGLDSEDDVYVADSGNHRVQIFSADGKYLSQFSTDTGRKSAKPSDPSDVAVNSKLQRCYVIDNDNHWLIIYDLANGKLIKTIGNMGTQKREFRFPFFLDMDREGNLYIVEVINTRVKVLDPDGKYIRTIGGWGVEKGEFYRPKGVAVDAKNRIYVSDSYLGVIQVFDDEGGFLDVVGDEKGNIIKFVSPTGIFIDNKMRLYVVEMLSNSVKVLRLKD